MLSLIPEGMVKIYKPTVGRRKNYHRRCADLFLLIEAAIWLRKCMVKIARQALHREAPRLTYTCFSSVQKEWREFRSQWAAENYQ